MTKLKDATKIITDRRHVNWFPGHMFAGMKAMIGKLNTCDCVIEVHDARIPFTGRNKEFRKHLGQVKPHILVLNKSDLADLSKWPDIKKRLAQQGDTNAILTDLTGHLAAKSSHGTLMKRAVELINESDRCNRLTTDHFKIMICGIPNVGKSSLVNRLRQTHLGLKGEPARVGAIAGVTKNVENRIKICNRPPIYMLDTPGVLQPSDTKSEHTAMRLAICATINDDLLDPALISDYLLNWFHTNDHNFYIELLALPRKAENIQDLYHLVMNSSTIEDSTFSEQLMSSSFDQFCWKFIRAFRKGSFGKYTFL